MRRLSLPAVCAVEMFPLDWAGTFPPLRILVAAQALVRARLFVVRRRRCVRLPDGAVFHAHAALGHSVKLLIRLIIKILGNVFRRWVEHREWLEVVQHLVIDAVDNRAEHLLKQLEVEQQASLVELAPASVTRTL